jgi:hypothetical protein
MNPESWEQAKEFGLVVSYGEREMRPWPCTNEQRLAGQCTATYNRFKFSTAPEPQEYWFVEAGAKQC